MPRTRGRSRLAGYCGLLLWVACALPSGARAYCRLTTAMPEPGPTGSCDAGGLPLYWAQRCVSYSLVEREQTLPPFDDLDADSDIRRVVDASMEAWLGVTCGADPLPFDARQTEELAACTTAEYNRKDRNANTIAFVEDWVDRGLPGDAFGVTLVWHDPNTGEILDADMLINESAGELSFCDRLCTGGGFDLQNVVTHEFGHFLGLAHSDEVNATMYAESRMGETRKRFPRRDDQEGVCAIYGGLSQPVCGDSDYAPRGGFGPACYRSSAAGGLCTVVGRQTLSGPRGGAGVVAAFCGVGALAVTRWRRRRRRAHAHRG